MTRKMGRPVISAFADEYSPAFAEQCEALSRLGIGYIEIRNADGKSIASMTEEETDRLGGILACRGIKVSSIGSPLGKIRITAGAGDIEEHMKKAERVFSAASKLGASRVRIFSFYIPAGEDKGAYADRVALLLNRFCDMADRRGLTLCHENEAGIYGESPEECEELLDRLDEVARQAYYSPYGTPEQKAAGDYLWYLWCGPDSPLYGKDKNAFFERTLLGDDAAEAKAERYAPYYELNRNEEICRMLLSEFGLDPEKGHIVNGHVPVLRADGQSPVRAGGKLFVIDGGISKAYRVKTGIAGYTLIYDSHSLRLAEHTPGEVTPTVSVVEKMPRRVNVADTDYGAELLIRITELRALLSAYRSGVIKENRA